MLHPLEIPLPEGWKITSMILIDPDWQVIIQDGEHVIVATGDSIEEAVDAAIEKSDYGHYSGRLFKLKDLIKDPLPKFDIMSIVNARLPKLRRLR
jgi:hypothetical protein